MTAFPVAERELRVTARSRMTYRVRLIAVGLGILMAGGVLGLNEFNLFPGYTGPLLFKLLVNSLFVVCWFAGIFLTADSLSEEKREGTLGLLFLTDLRSFDIVAGKFLATSLQAFLALLAMLPILAIALLLGGVSPGEFWRMTLVLPVVLLFSLALGILVSASHEESSKAMNHTFGWLMLTGALGWAGYYFLPGTGDEWYYKLLWPSPSYAFLKAWDGQYSRFPIHFWGSIMTIVGASFLGMMVSCARLRSNLTRPAEVRERKTVWARGSLGTTSISQWRRRNHKLLDSEPMRWLLTDAFLQGQWMRVIAVLTIAVQVMILVFASASVIRSSGGFPAGFGIGAVGLTLISIFFTRDACRFFAEGRHTGALEMLLSTPLSWKEIVEGQWRMLKSNYLLIIAIILALDLAILLVPFLIKLMKPSWHPDLWAQYGISILMQAYYVAKHALDFLALGWVGMWFALSTRKPTKAFLQTFLLVIVVPWFALCIPKVAITIPLFFWGRNKVLNSFNRELLIKNQVA